MKPQVQMNNGPESAAARPVLIMAGGTGGHVFPALAVAEELRGAQVPVVWLGTRSGLEARVVPAAGLPIEWLSIAGLRGQGWGRRLLAPWMLTRALWQAWRVLRRVRPRAVLGMGGFVAGPGGVAAWLLRIPLLIHEQNAVAGLTNRRLAGLAGLVMEAFPNALALRHHPVLTGNPVRREISALPPPEQRGLAAAGRPCRLLVLGGSLGAAALNAALGPALAALAPGQRPEVRHQCGRDHLAATEAAYARAGVTARIEPFIEDMAAAYAWADLVIARAGALTIAELTAAGLGAVLVPYPHAVDDHQTHNARWMVAAGAAELLPQTRLSPENLTALLRPLLGDPGRLRRMARAARRLARPDAAHQVAGHCLQNARPAPALDGETA